MNSPHLRLAMQLAGRGRLEGHPPGDVDGARFEGRFVVFGLFDHDAPVFGEDVSLFAADAVAEFGRGPQSAHLVAIRSGITLEGFVTDHDSDFQGHTFGRSSSETRFRVYFDASPDGSRSFDDRASFQRGELVATYKAEEFFQIDPRAGVFDTRVNYSLLESTPFTFNGRTIDFADLYPAMVEMSHGHNPEPDPSPEIIPDEPPFSSRGPGVFANRFPVGGTLFALT
ncbi:hypothetical protein [Nocardioides sp. NPDC006303]|uniref:hypothetical protein n=1 Tax=Nocardioides sp. NPDC006303 TaxID=3156747 RepID=UPI0033A4FA75